MLKIGHITDLHLRRHLSGSSICLQRRSRDVFWLFEEALKRFKKESVDIIVLTGDLLDVPNVLLKPDDYYDYQLERVRKQTRDDYLLLKNSLDQIKIPYIVLPGNHDLDAIFWKVFDKDENELIAKGHRFIRFCDREVGQQAHRFDYERDRMKDVLSDENDMPQIHLQHYVIHPSLNEGYPHTYFDANDLKRRLTDSKKVKLSVSGHYHSGTELLTIGKTKFVTGPSFSEHPHPIRIYSIDDNDVEMKTISLLDKPVHFDKPIAFLDRDGVINTLPAYHTGPDLLVLTKNAGKAIANLHKAGYVVVVITSQSCVGMGYVHQNTIYANHDYLCNLLRDNGGDEAQPDLFLFSTGAGTSAVHESLVDSSNAKPSTKLPEQAIDLLKARIGGSFFIGDNATDVETGNNLGIDSYLLKTGAGEKTLERLELSNDKSLNFKVVENLFELSKLLLSKES